MTRFTVTLALLFSLLLSAPPSASAQSVTVTAAYRERIALPQDAQLEVQLLDVSRADQAAIRLTSQRFAMGSVPMQVQLPYDPALIVSGARYSVSAVLWAGERAMFRTDTAYPVFGDGFDGTVDLRLVMAPPSGSDISQPQDLIGDWTVTTLRGAVWAGPQPGTFEVNEAGAVAISAGCNRFIARPDIGAGTITFEEGFPGTLMACPQEIERAERALLDALAEVSGYAVSGERLALTSGAGDPVLRMRRTRQ